MNKKRRKTVGLALGSGGAKGYAHLGVLKVFEENNIPIDYLSGSSAGSIVATLYSLYGNTSKVEEILTDFNGIRSLIDFSFKGGIVKGKKITDFFENIFEGKKLQDLKIPVCVVATDYETGAAVEIKRGDIALAVRSSIAVPFVFELVKYRGKELADGGLSSPVPINSLKKMGADITIGVRVEDRMGKSERRNFYSMAERSLNILQHNLSNSEIEKSDILIDPYFEDYGILGLHKVVQGKVKEAILEGEKSAKEQISSIKKLIGEEKEISAIYKL